MAPTCPTPGRRPSWPSWDAQGAVDIVHLRERPRPRNRSGVEPSWSEDTPSATPIPNRRRGDAWYDSHRPADTRRVLVCAPRGLLASREDLPKLSTEHAVLTHGRSTTMQGLRDYDAGPGGRPDDEAGWSPTIAPRRLCWPRPAPARPWLQLSARPRPRGGFSGRCVVQSLPAPTFRPWAEPWRSPWCALLEAVELTTSADARSCSTFRVEAPVTLPVSSRTGLEPRRARWWRGWPSDPAARPPGERLSTVATVNTSTWGRSSVCFSM